jgi:hypothetical protein
VFNLTTVTPKIIALACLCILEASLLTGVSKSTPSFVEISSYGPSERESAYLAANDKAMNKMMREMHIRPSGDVDSDFVAQMIPHHQGAIDMASALLKTGGNETLKRLAQEIIVTQKEEIVAMRLAIGESPGAVRRDP